MKRFPAGVRRAMREVGAAATCVPVRLDGGAWECAIFVQLAGMECAHDREVITGASAALPVAIETDIIEHENAAIITLRLEVYTAPQDPMAAEVLLIPGAGDAHFEVLKRLAAQSRLVWFFSDEAFRVIHAQQHALSPAQNAEFDRLLMEAVRHDALVRCAGRHDPKVALAAVVAHYRPRPASTPGTRRRM